MLIYRRAQVRLVTLTSVAATHSISKTVHCTYPTSASHAVIHDTLFLMFIFWMGGTALQEVIACKHLITPRQISSYGSVAQIQVIWSPWRLNFLQWQLILVLAEWGTWFMPRFGRLEFWSGSYFWKISALLLCCILWTWIKADNISNKISNLYRLYVVRHTPILV